MAQAIQTRLIDMRQLLRAQDAKPLMLHQVAGPDAPRDFQVLPLQKAIIGRLESCEISVFEGMVSREHSRIDFGSDIPTITDLGSTNGTFVNGVRVESSELADGDRLQVGSAVFELFIGTDSTHRAHSRVSQIHDLLRDSAAHGRATKAQQSALSGNLGNIQLPMLLQMLEGADGTGTLVARGSEQGGAIYFENGSPIHAFAGATRGLKAICRLLSMEDGNFEYFTPGQPPEERTLSNSLQFYLLEAARSADEIAIYVQHLPDPQTELQVTPNRAVSLAEVPVEVLDVLAAAKRHPILEDLIEFCDLPDLDAYRMLHMLMAEGILAVSETQATGAVRQQREDHEHSKSESEHTLGYE